jgi:hypothetical protein
VREALHASHAEERREHEEAIERLKAEHKFANSLCALRASSRSCTPSFM